MAQAYLQVIALMEPSESLAHPDIAQRVLALQDERPDGRAEPVRAPVRTRTSRTGPAPVHPTG
ncbi:hypothetical protein ACFQ2B_06515 [Streptomyces stramineus]